jgi:hypothetical protein
MNIIDVLNDKTKKGKEKTSLISQWLLYKSLPAHESLASAQKLKGAAKATCIEALEYATKQQPAIADEAVLDFVTTTLTEKAPRIKWESAKVIGNIAQLFPAKLDQAIAHLLVNAAHDGTVVSWASAYALGEMLKLQNHNKTLLITIEAICAKEENNGVKKLYLAAIKKLEA